MKYFFCLILFCCKEPCQSLHSYFNFFPDSRGELEHLGYKDLAVIKDKSFSYYRKIENDTIIQFNYGYSDKIYSKRITIFGDSLGLDGMIQRFSFLEGNFRQEEDIVFFTDKVGNQYLVWTANIGRAKRPAIQFEYETPELKKEKKRYESPFPVITDSAFKKQ